MEMPVRRLLAVAIWLCVTASATAIVWTGTSAVVADLTDRPPPVVAHGEVVTALESGASDAKTAPGITTPDASRSTPTVPSDRPPPASAGTPAPGSSGAQTAPPGAPTPPPPPPPPPRPPSGPPPTQPPPQPTASYSTAGGVVTVACNGYFFIDLISATPRHGYRVDVVSGGPYYVEVHFVRAGQDEPVWAFCLGQPIRTYEQPRRQGPGSS